MRKTIIILITTLFLLPAICFGQVDPTASKVADTYLKGAKLIELPEGKKMIFDTSWWGENDPPEGFPVFTEASTLFEGMFSTDIPNIQGYKRLIDLKAVSKAGTPLIKRYILISFKNPVTKKWKVLSFRESADIEYEAKAAGRDLDETLNWTFQSYGYWLLLSGRIKQAKEAFIKASELNKRNPQKSQAEFDLDIEIIRRITEK